MFDTEPYHTYDLRYHISCTLTNILCAIMSVFGITISEFPVVWRSNAYLSQRGMLQTLHMFDLVKYMKDIVFDDRYLFHIHEKQSFPISLAVCAFVIADSELYLAACTFILILAITHTLRNIRNVSLIFRIVTIHFCIVIAFLQQSSANVTLLNMLSITSMGIVLLERLSMPIHARVFHAMTLLMITITLSDTAHSFYVQELSQVKTSSQIVIKRESFKTMVSKLFILWKSNII